MYIKLLAFLIGFLVTLLIINYITIQKKKIETFDPTVTSITGTNLISPNTPITPSPPVISSSSSSTPAPSSSTPAPTPAPSSTPAQTSSTTPTTTSSGAPLICTPAPPPNKQSLTPTKPPEPNLTDAKNLPYPSNKYMAINTYKNVNLISNIEKRWYEADTDITKLKDITENSNNYFTFATDLTLIPNQINPSGSAGANLKGVQLNGPKCFHFANNKETNEVTEFSVIICANIKDVLNTNNILFELIANTESLNPETLEYSPSLINVNFIKNVKNNFDISISIGNVVYKGLINNIDRNAIITNDFIVICLVYTTSEINFYLNKVKFTYKNTETFKVKYGSAPLVINKKGTIDMELYNFMYYKTFIPEDEINKFTKNTYYYLSGLDYSATQCQSQTPPVSSEAQQTAALEKRLKDLEDNYIKALERKRLEYEMDAQRKQLGQITPLTYDFGSGIMRTLNSGLMPNLSQNLNIKVNPTLPVTPATPMTPVIGNENPNSVATLGLKVNPVDNRKSLFGGWLF